MNYEVQSILFNREIWSHKDAVGWLHHHHYIFKKLDATPNYWRFRQHDPKKLQQICLTKLRNKYIGQGITLILAYLE